MKSKILWMALGSLITILVISCHSFVTSYDKSVDSTADVMVIYKHTTVFTSLSADIRDYISFGRKELYFGKLPSQEEAINISVPFRANIYVYPSDNDSVIVRYDPRNGISRNYKISGYGNFYKVLNAFYEHTDNEIFNKTYE